jgi:hypothetical protein
MANKLYVESPSSDGSGEGQKTFLQRPDAFRSAPAIADPGPTDVPAALGPNWDDEEDWQRFFL